MAAQQRADRRRDQCQFLARDGAARQRCDVHRRGFQYRRKRHESCCPTDRYAHRGRADDHGAAARSLGSYGPNRNFQRHGDRNAAARLPMAARQRADRRRDQCRLLARDGAARQRCDVHRRGFQHRRKRHQSCCPTDRYAYRGRADEHGAAARFVDTCGADRNLQRHGDRNAAATNAGYSLVTALLDNGATFTAVVSNAAGSVTSRAARLTVTPIAVAPTITAQPLDLSILAGLTATFSVTATGTPPLAYQWLRNSVPIAGATNASYSLVTALLDNGATFAAVVSNTAGSVTSRAARLTVTPIAVAPTITAQPLDLSILAGLTATFSVTATGTPPLAYQWLRDSVPIAGATNAGYSLVTALLDNGATFTAVVSNAAGSVTSRAARLIVTPIAVAPTITAQPLDLSVVTGLLATFSVTATGTPPLAYQWLRNCVPITDATNVTFSLVTALLDNGATFTAVVSNTAGSVTSRAARLTVTPIAVAPTITGQPLDLSILAGLTATFSVTATGTPPLAYHCLRDSVPIAGATNASFSLVTALLDNGATFTAVVSNTAGSVTSRAARLTVTPVTLAPTITGQ